MSSNNNENAGLAFMLAGLIIASFVFMAFLAVISMVLTLLSIIAWRKPLRLGKFTITSQEARRFVGTGVAGAIVLPVCLSLAYYGFHIPLAGALLPYSIFGGYVVGSLGYGLYLTMLEEQAAESTPPPVARQIVARTSESPAAKPTREFEYASWDDDEETR